ncbi:MAG: hypothetical protein ACXVW9_11720 [Nocardioidaceae bacterium]
MNRRWWAGVRLPLFAAILGLLVWRVGTGPWARTLRAARSDLRDDLLTRRAWPAVTGGSAVAVAGHVATLLVAARTAGVTASPLLVLPLALLVLLAMGLPANVAGWGPREGAAAWAFGAAGLGAGRGLATAVAYGVIVFAASLPGAVVLVVAWLQDGRSTGDRSRTVAPARGGSRG